MSLAAPSIDERRAYYERPSSAGSTLYGVTDWVHRRLEDRVQALVRRYISGPTTLYDVGCSDGRHLRALADWSVGQVGVDLAWRRLVQARELADGEASCYWVQGDAQSLPLASQQAGAVMCIETLEHVPHLGLALRELHRVLAHEGRLVCSIPTEADEWLSGDKQHRTWQENSGHLHRLSRRGFRQLLQQSGFQVLAEDVIDVLGPKVRDVISRCLMPIRRSIILGRGRSRGRASASHEWTTQACGAWYRLDERLSQMRVINRRGSYCVFVCRHV